MKDIGVAMKNERVHILGTPVDPVDMNTALEYVREAVKTRTCAGAIFAINPEKVFLLRQDPDLKRHFEEAFLLIPDGIGIVKALRILYGKRISRCPGADLMHNICMDAPLQGYKIFVYGSSDTVNTKACIELCRRYPGIQIVGHSNGFVKPEEMDHLVAMINNSQADILFVAMGSPKQERWISQYASKLTTVKVCQGIGGTLDTIVGTVKRAPTFWQVLGLEWFYRLLCQPSRFKRQIRCFRFAFEVFRCKATGYNKQ